MGDESGFTLIEMVMTALVVGVAILAVGNIFDSISVSNRDARTQTIATQAAQQEMETVRNTPYANLTVGTTTLSTNLNAYPLLPSPKSETLVVSQYDPNGLKQVDVSVNYIWHGATKTVKFTTLVAANGINH